MADLKPLTKHLGEMDRSEASRKGAAVKSMVESEGWTVLLELIEKRQRHEQKALMHGRARNEEEQGTYERVIGQWAGMERVPALAAGMIALGAQASREMESGQAAEAATN
jgi:hypothetical protein